MKNLFISSFLAALLFSGQTVMAPPIQIQAPTNKDSLIYQLRARNLQTLHHIEQKTKLYEPQNFW
jgi:hypothetical protein